MFIHLNSIDSTNAEAKRRIIKGEAEHADIILADKQTQGRGRRDNKWASPIGNLYFSLIVTPQLDEKDWGCYSILNASILLRVLGSIVEPTRISFKWPNDVLIDNRKISGILIESLYQASKPFLVIGVGVNILHYPPSSDFPSTSLIACGVPEALPDTLLQRYMAEFDVNWQTFQIDGLSSFYEGIRKNFYALDCVITMSLSEHRNTEGYCRGIDARGHLIVEDYQGKSFSYASGEILKVRSRI